uniref:Uncharacterized protein n=1 Tax=Rhizophora mucronata TaxID=61149 RepID=A0A2P2J3D6_RHIMU
MQQGKRVQFNHIDVERSGHLKLQHSYAMKNVSKKLKQLMHDKISVV